MTATCEIELDSGFFVATWLDGSAPLAEEDLRRLEPIGSSARRPYRREEREMAA